MDGANIVPLFLFLFLVLYLGTTVSHFGMIYDYPEVIDALRPM